MFSVPEPPRALEILAAKRQAELWDSTLSFLERGKAEDEAGNYAAAAILISEGIAGLEALSEVSKREDVLAQYTTILGQYTQRLQELRTLAHTQAAQAVAIGLPMGTPVPVPASAEAEDVSDASAPAASAPAADSSSVAPSDSAKAAPLAQGRLCLELAMSADEQGFRDEETVALYTAAAEHYFEALKLESEEEAQARHRATVKAMLERAEQLKHGPRAAPPAAAAEAPSAAQPAPAAPATAATAAAAAAGGARRRRAATETRAAS